MKASVGDKVLGTLASMPWQPQPPDGATGPCAGVQYSREGGTPSMDTASIVLQQNEDSNDALTVPLSAVSVTIVQSNADQLWCRPPSVPTTSVTQSLTSPLPSLPFSPLLLTPGSGRPWYALPPCRPSADLPLQVMASPVQIPLPTLAGYSPVKLQSPHRSVSDLEPQPLVIDEPDTLDASVASQVSEKPSKSKKRKRIESPEVKTSKQAKKATSKIQSVKIEKVKNVKSEKPSISYTELIARAILSIPECRMLLGDIYSHLMNHYPYFREVQSQSWKSSVRHALSSSKCFVRNCDGRSKDNMSFWSIHPSCLEEFRAGNFNRRMARKKVQQVLTQSDLASECSTSPSPVLDSVSSGNSNTPQKSNTNGYVTMTCVKVDQALFFHNSIRKDFTARDYEIECGKLLGYYSDYAL